MTSKTKPRLLFVVTEDWFFCSHFLPMAEAAKNSGYEVAIACRVRGHGDVIRNLGYILLPFESERRSLNPLHFIASIVRMKRLMQDYSPHLLHLIALKPVIIGGLSARLLGIQNRIIALTGLGFIGALGGEKITVLQHVIKRFIRFIVDGPCAHYLFENRSDQHALGLNPNHPRILIVGGAGVDQSQFEVAPLPIMPPLRIAFVGRMVWSKGVDTLVEALRLLRVRGADIQLSLYGAPDSDNPRTIPADTLQAWASEEGIHWHGSIKQSEVNAVWSNHHCAVLASRGGEGLPRSLLEAASCGRAIITTDVPGCRDLVRDGVEGFIVPFDNAVALAEAIAKLYANPDLLQTMGDAARQRILTGYTTDHLKAEMTKLYRSMLS